MYNPKLERIAEKSEKLFYSWSPSFTTDIGKVFNSILRASTIVPFSGVFQLIYNNFEKTHKNH